MSKPTSLKNVIAMAITSCGMAFTAPASAALITYDFEGTIEFADYSAFYFGTDPVTENPGPDGIFEGKSAGDIFSGSFTIDTAGTLESLVTSPFGDEVATYSGTFDVTIDGTSYAADTFEVALHTEFGPEYEINFFFEVDGNPTGRLGILWFGVSGLPTDIPSVLPPPVSFGSTVQLFADLPPPTGHTTDSGMLTSFSASETSVPAPGTLVLVGLGLIGIGVRRRIA